MSAKLERDFALRMTVAPWGYEPRQIAGQLAAALDRIDRLERELARAAGVTRARGEHAYADDFMRVAMDRDDFDAEVKEAKR